jgi:hypothetical protein
VYGKMAYITVSDLRTLTNLTVDDLTDAEIDSLITYATAQFNRDTQKRIIREPIEYIDDTRTNYIDGSNTTYYVKNWEGNYFADSDNDGDVDTSDITVYQVDSDSNETVLTVSSIDEDDMYFTLSSAPESGVTLYVTYNYLPIPSDHTLLKLAVAYLVAALGYGKINLGRPTNFQVGEIRVVNHIDAVKQYMKAYEAVVAKINDGMLDMVEADNVPF